MLLESHGSCSRMPWLRRMHLPSVWQGCRRAWSPVSCGPCRKHRTTRTRGLQRHIPHRARPMLYSQCGGMHRRALGVQGRSCLHPQLRISCMCRALCMLHVSQVCRIVPQYCAPVRNVHAVRGRVSGSWHKWQNRGQSPVSVICPEHRSVFPNRRLHLYVAGQDRECLSEVPATRLFCRRVQ